jgi:hypothetical protein
MDANINEGSKVGSQPVETNINVTGNAEINKQIVYKKPVVMVFNSKNQVATHGRYNYIIFFYLNFFQADQGPSLDIIMNLACLIG